MSKKKNEHIENIEEILKTAESIYRTSASEIYFQLKAKYLAFIKKSKTRALQVLDEGLKQFKGSFYIYKDYFESEQYILKNILKLDKNDDINDQIILLQCIFQSFFNIEGMVDKFKKTKQNFWMKM